MGNLPRSDSQDKVKLFSYQDFSTDKCVDQCWKLYSQRMLVWRCGFMLVAVETILTEITERHFAQGAKVRSGGQ